VSDSGISLWNGLPVRLRETHGPKAPAIASAEHAELHRNCAYSVYPLPSSEAPEPGESLISRQLTRPAGPEHPSGSSGEIEVDLFTFLNHGDGIAPVTTRDDR
jgi:hypothetical protein